MLNKKNLRMNGLKLALPIIIGLGGFCSAALADRRPTDNSDPTHDIDGNTEQKIHHRLSPEIFSQSPFSKNSSTPSMRAPSAGSTATSASPITYHGGPIMNAVSKVVLIWYGNWNQTNRTDTPAGQQIIRDAIWGIAQQNIINNYSGITTGFYSNLGLYTQTRTSFVTQASSPSITEFVQTAKSTYGGQTLTDASVFSLVKAFAGTGDPNAIYLVLSSSDIKESSGFLTTYCGWHSYGSVGTNKIKFGFIGNPNRSLSACSVQSISPNVNPAVDAMISVIAHELVETVSDPLLNAWYNGSGAENSDMCAWTFGSNVQQLSTGAYWNVNLPTPNGQSRNYLLQRQLSAKDSKCYINATGPIQ